MLIPTLSAAFHTSQTFILDTLFPRRCLGCRAFDTWLCDACHTRLPILTEQHCPFCTQAITPLGEVCLLCAQKNTPALSGVFVASPYTDSLLKKAIHHYKYRFVKELSEPLALLLAQVLAQSHLPAPDLIIAVPLHNRRLRWRGFNQSLSLCNALDLTIPTAHDVLIRTRFTTSQVTMKNKIRRQQNLSGAFSVTHPDIIEDCNILLIDDVTTTSTTLEECAQTLKDAGARSVYGLVLARDL